MAEPARTSHSDLSKLDVARIRTRLTTMRAELDARRSGRDLLHLKQIEDALAKLARGVYGNCESCARPVVKTRLLETPHVRYCGVCSGGRRTSSSPRGASANA
jgi:RNA polymerase-binding transcription factor DksA